MSQIVAMKSAFKHSFLMRVRNFTAIIDIHSGSSNSLYDKTLNKITKTNGEFTSSLYESMTENALRNSDSITLNKLVEYASDVECNVDQSVEKAVLFYLWEKDYLSAVNILKVTDPYKVRISEVTCQHLLAETMEQMHWGAAYTVTSRMILHDYQMSGRDMSLVVAGLMGTTEGVTKSLCLLQLIIEKRRSDLAQTFLYRPVRISGNFIFSELC